MARTYKTLVAAIAHEAYQYLKSVSPYDSGNLRDNAIKIYRVGPRKYAIDVDGFIAPYAVYTNEKWISPKWRGKKNPNEKWIDMAAQHVATAIIPARLYSAGLRFKAKTNNDEEIARWENSIYYDRVIPIFEQIRRDTQ